MQWVFQRSPARSAGEREDVVLVPMKLDYSHVGLQRYSKDRSMHGLGEKVQWVLLLAVPI